MSHASIEAKKRFSLPAQWRRPQPTLWGSFNFPGTDLECFLEGPSFDRYGGLYLVDIPFGRIFHVSAQGHWSLRCQYDGWPNGLKLHANGDLFLADYRRGILRLGPEQELPCDHITSFRSEGFKGCNDLFFDDYGVLYFTDQGQSGLHDPSGRVFSADPSGDVIRLLDGIPSPNGLVMNQQRTQLLVAVTRSNAVWRLPLVNCQAVTKVGLFIQLSGGLAGPDGLAMDADGGLLVCHPGVGVWRFDRIGRPTHLVEAPAGSVWTNLAFGGDGFQDLHIVDSVAGDIYVAKMPFRGALMYSHA